MRQHNEIAKALGVGRASGRQCGGLGEHERESLQS
jgi:hypothetical protein